MAFDGSINIDSSIDGGGVSKGLEKLGGVAKSTLSGLLTIMGGVAAAVGGAAIAGVKYNAQMEQYITSFGTMLGSADKASALVANLKKFAADTPFEFTDLAKGSQTLLSFGVSASDLMPTLKMLGDVSQGNTDKFNALSLAFGQVSSAGKMQGQDLLQFINAGFNPLQVMAQKTGKSMSDLRDEMAAGKISAQDVADAFKTATSAGGMFYNAMESQSKTFSGQLSTLKDNASQFLGELTAGLESSLKDAALPMVNGWMDQLQSAFNSGGVQGVVAAFGMVLSKAVSAVASQAPQMIGLATSLIQAFANGLSQNTSQLSNSAISIISALASGIYALLPTLGGLALKLILSLMQGLTEHADQIVTGASNLIGILVNGLVQAAPQLAAAAVKLAQAFFNALMRQHPTGTPLVGGVIAAIGAVKGVQGAFSGLDSIASGLDKLSTSGDLLKKAFKTISGPFKDAKGNLDIIRVAASETGDKFGALGSKALGALKSLGGGALSAGKGLLGMGASAAKTAADFAAMGAKALWAGIQLAAQKVAALAAAAAQKVMAAAQWLLNAAMNANPISIIIIAIAALVAALVILWNTNSGFRNAVISIWTAIIGFFQMAGSAIAGFFTSTWGAIQSAWSAVVGFFSGVWAGIVAIFNVVVGWFGSIFRAAWSGIQTAWSAVVGFFKGIWNGIVSIFNVVVAYYSGVFRSAWSAIVGIWSAVVGFFRGVWNGISSVFAGVSGWFGGVFRGAWSAITGVFGVIGSWFSDKFNAAKNAILAIFKPNMLSDAGGNLLKGLWNGIQNTMAWLKDKIIGIGPAIVNAAKRALGIHSPSRLFRDEIGAMLPPGIAIGFEDAIPSAASDMQAQMDALTAKMQASVTAQQGNAAFSVAAASVPSVSIIVQPADVSVQVDNREIARAANKGNYSISGTRRYR